VQAPFNGLSFAVVVTATGLLYGSRHSLLDLWGTAKGPAGPKLRGAP
jgi:hypothetical protein